MKKGTWIIALVAAVVVLAAGAVWAKNYYDNRYVGYDYYTRVPVDQPVQVGDLRDNQGNAVDKGYAYHLTGYDVHGRSRELSFLKSGATPEALYAPGTYLLVSASQQIVLNERVIDKTEVPTSIVDKLG